jgi:hypothetical protein
MRCLAWGLFVCLGLSGGLIALPESHPVPLHEEDESLRSAQESVREVRKKQVAPPSRDSFPPAPIGRVLREAPEKPPRVLSWTARLHQRSPAL